MKRRSKLTAPPTPMTETFYHEAAMAGFSLEQVRFLERYFSLDEDNEDLLTMSEEHSARVEYVSACRAVGKEPEVWDPTGNAPWSR